jgi:3-methyladenine DNA glycosylase AlkD
MGKKPAAAKPAITSAEIVKQLKALGEPSYKRILMNHGAEEPVLGVKIAELKRIQKRIKKDYRLALELFDTGIYDAQYLAGLIADEHRMTEADFRRWLAKSNGATICGTAVAPVLAESEHAHDLALEWIDSKNEKTAQTGWTVLAGWVSVTDDADLDVGELKRLLARVEKTIHSAPNLVRYTMNGFVIALGAYVSKLTEAAIRAGEKIGPVSVDMGNTACEVPFAPQYIEKIQKRGTIGKKRKTARC